MTEEAADRLFAEYDREELERRWQDIQENPDDGEPWEAVKTELQSE